MGKLVRLVEGEEEVELLTHLEIYNIVERICKSNINLDKFFKEKYNMKDIEQIIDEEFRARFIYFIEYDKAFRREIYKMIKKEVKSQIIPVILEIIEKLESKPLWKLREEIRKERKMVKGK